MKKKSKEEKFAGNISRRRFLKTNAIISTGLIFGKLSYAISPGKDDFIFSDGKLKGNLKEVSGPEILPDGQWFEAKSAMDGIEYSFEEGALEGKKFITADLILDGRDLSVFRIKLFEANEEKVFQLRFGLINQCSARVRFPLQLLDMNRWRIEREGAWLKPMTAGDRVDPARVNKMTFELHRKSERPSRWCMSNYIATESEPLKIENPILPEGKLLDEMGQSTLHSWSAKSNSKEEVTKRLNTQLKDANDHKWPDYFSGWGGWKEMKFNATGYFSKHFDGKRWWLVDPDGFAFWSAGLDCVRVDSTANIEGLESALSFVPPGDGKYADIYTDRMGAKHINYLAANFIRAFGKENWRKKWADIALSQLRRLRFNTVGNWSEWEYAAEAGFPYVRPLHFSATSVKNVFRDFPDIYDPNFESDAMEYARALENTVDDPALIGYFMMNEPTWGFTSILPAAGMLQITPECHTRIGLHDFLKKRYDNEETLASAWEVPVTFNKIKKGLWKLPLKEKALKDLEEFSEIMVEKYFKTLHNACKKVDPNHMNLGIRYAGVPPSWTVKGMSSFDVFSMNSYSQKIPADDVEEIHNRLNMPVMIGEWHFGALDVGLPASGIGRVKNQEERGKAYKIYLEDAAANPYCIGTHWFTLYDQSALGRFDGENYNIGFLDICNRPYEEICDAAKKSHEAIYNIATGKIKPFDDAPEYLNKLYL